MMKKIITLSTFALIMMLPLVSSASSITNTFLTSSTGRDFILPGETIQFEVTITLNSGQNYTTVLWTLSGDFSDPGIDSATQATGWVGINNTVIDWAWHYTGAGGKVDMGTNGRFAPMAAPAPPPDAVTGPYGFFGTSKTGDGIPTLVGTVTILGVTPGVYSGGGYIQLGVGTFAGSTAVDSVTVSGGYYEVAPEPGTALLLMLGLVGLGVAGRSNRK